MATTLTLGPADGTLTVRTERIGAAAKAGHDLLIEVDSWEATLELPGDNGEHAFQLLTDKDPDALEVLLRAGAIAETVEEKCGLADAWWRWGALTRQICYRNTKGEKRRWVFCAF